MNVGFVKVKYGGTYSNHLSLQGYSSVIKASHLIMIREIIAVCSEIRTKHINALCGLNVGFMTVKSGGTYSNHWGLQG